MAQISNLPDKLVNKLLTLAGIRGDTVENLTAQVLAVFVHEQEQLILGGQSNLSDCSDFYTRELRRLDQANVELKRS